MTTGNGSEKPTPQVAAKIAPNDITTLVAGSTALLTTNEGCAIPSALLGLFYADERLLSLVSVTVDGESPELLDHRRSSPSSARVASLVAVDRYRNGRALLIRRQELQAGGLLEHVELRSFGSDRTAEIEIVLESDAASVLGLKSALSSPRPLAWDLDPQCHGAIASRSGVPFVVVEMDRLDGGSYAEPTDRAHGDPWADSVGQVSLDGSRLRLKWMVELKAGGVWRANWSARVPSQETVGASPYTRFSALVVQGDDPRWSPAISSAIVDLAALIIELPEVGERFIGAGAPWYLALFGRDTLISAWETLPLGTDLPLDVLETLSHYQGRAYDERTQQAPGKILHERRIGLPQVFGMQHGSSYYGSVDSSALFVMLLAEAYRWGADVARVRGLLGAARQAITWCLNDGRLPDMPGGMPFLWYRSDRKGLGNQGWKDSGDCMVNADGTLADGPFAVAEAQAYLYEALLGMARLEEDLGDKAAAGVHRSEAALLSAAFEERFVLPDGLIALALRGDGKALDVATSNMGQCLWSGILRPEVAHAVAQRTMRADLLCRWGIRTLGANERAYNPLGYHLGTVWAHDTAIVAAGLAQHGEAEFTRTLVDSLLGASRSFGFRLPELYAGLDGAIGEEPLPYPAACSPQAWSAGAPLLLLRSILRLRPDIPAGTLQIQPLLADGQTLKVDGLRLGNSDVSIVASGNTLVSVRGLDGLTLVQQPN